jgi:hypothetical protein
VLAIEGAEIFLPHTSLIQRAESALDSKVTRFIPRKTVYDMVGLNEHLEVIERFQF